MDDPTSRCENGTDNETHSPRPPIPSGGLIFILKLNSGQLACSDAPILERMLVPPRLAIPKPNLK
jgi:hypothetical protein